MNTAEWILVAFLSTALLIFIILGIVLLAKLIGIAKEAKKIVVKGQDIAANANDVVTNVKGLTSVGGVVQSFTDKYMNPKHKKTKEKKDGKEDVEED